MLLVNGYVVGSLLQHCSSSLFVFRLLDALQHSFKATSIRAVSCDVHSVPLLANDLYDKAKTASLIDCP